MRNSFGFWDSVAEVFETGATVQVYEYDSGQPNNRGTLLGTATEIGTTGIYYIDLTAGARVVVVKDSSNVTSGEGVKFWGDLIGESELSIVKDSW